MRCKACRSNLVECLWCWASLKANDSLECRNCHSSAAMDFTKQTRRAGEIHAKFLVTGEKTCIDCHKPIPLSAPSE